MVDVNLISGGVWTLGGIAILYLGYQIAVRGRVELHSDYDESVDPGYVARRSGGVALLMGAVTVAHGVREMVRGFDPAALAALIVTLLVLSYLSKLFARGYGYAG